MRTSQVKSDIPPAVCVPWVLQCWRALHFVDSGQLLIANKHAAPFRYVYFLPQALLVVSNISQHLFSMCICRLWFVVEAIIMCQTARHNRRSIGNVGGRSRSWKVTYQIIVKHSIPYTYDSFYCVAKHWRAPGYVWFKHDVWFNSFVGRATQCLI